MFALLLLLLLSVVKEELIKFWKSSACGSRSRIFEGSFCLSTFLFFFEIQQPLFPPRRLSFGVFSAFIIIIIIIYSTRALKKRRPPPRRVCSGFRTLESRLWNKLPKKHWTSLREVMTMQCGKATIFRIYNILYYIYA